GKNAHAVELLVSATNDANETVRAGVMLSRVEKADPAALDAAIKALNDPSTQVRSAAVMAIERIGETPALSRRASDALLPLLDEQTEPRVRATAMLGLAKLKDPRVLPALENLARSSLQKQSADMFPAPNSATAMNALGM